MNNAIDDAMDYSMQNWSVFAEEYVRTRVT